METGQDLGWYYLHTDGGLHWKKFEPEADSTFVKKVWDMSVWAATREKFIEFLKEAHALGADLAQVEKVADKNQIGLYELGIEGR